MARSALDLRRTSDEILRELIATLAREVAHEAKAIADLERKSLPEASASSTHDRDADDPLQVPVKEAARLLGFCRQTLYRMRADGQIAFRKMRGRVMVPMSEIKRLARDEGMTFLREAGIEKVRAGITTLREINKVTFIE